VAVAVRDVLAQACGAAALQADVLASLVTTSSPTAAVAASAPGADGRALLSAWLPPLGSALVATASAAVDEAGATRAAEERAAAEDADLASFRLALIDTVCPSDPTVNDDAVRSMVRARGCVASTATDGVVVTCTGRAAWLAG
jgi:hypothetical protein